MLHWPTGPTGHQHGALLPEAKHGLIANQPVERHATSIKVHHPSQPDENWQLVATSDILGWRTSCSCGWRGPRRHVRKPGSNLLPSNGTESAALTEWQHHLTGQKMIKQLIDELATYQATDRVIPWERERASAQLGTVICETRKLLTWQEIGDALGVTRQAAHARLAPHLKDGPSTRY